MCATSSNVMRGCVHTRPAHCVPRSTLSSAVLFKKPLVLRSRVVCGTHWLEQGGGTQGPLPHSLPVRLGHCREVWEPETTGKGPVPDRKESRPGPRSLSLELSLFLLFSEGSFPTSSSEGRSQLTVACRDWKSFLTACLNPLGWHPLNPQEHMRVTQSFSQIYFQAMSIRYIPRWTPRPVRSGKLPPAATSCHRGILSVAT